MGIQVKLNYNIKYQEIEGFGASGAWWAQDVGGWSNISEIMDFLYESKKGIGLNIYRYNIGAGYPCLTDDPWRSTQTIEVSPGLYDMNRDKNSINAMKEAVKHGATVELFSVSPPARLTKSGYSSGEASGKSNLSEENEDEYAKYLADITQLFFEKGIPVKYLSPINEPQWNWKSGQEGCHYEPGQVLDLSRKVTLELKKRKLPVKLSIDESGKWNDRDYTLSMYRTVMQDDLLSKAIDHFAVHSYWSNADDKREAAIYFSQFNNMLPLHQTEWCEMKNGNAKGMDAALVLAKTIHEDMTILSVSTWEAWLAVAKGDYRDGLVYVNTATEEYETSKRLWSFGNYSRFIRPGYRRIKAEIEDNNLLVSAYVSPKSDKTVIVFVNPSKEEKSIVFNGLNGKYSEVYETSVNYNCSLVKKIADLQSYILPSESVTTFVIQAK
ncbi:MAG: glycoside hydrolase [Clostridiales bacterium]|nr:glycoside hydrolase [Clostridiales bacterium]